MRGTRRNEIYNWVCSDKSIDVINVGALIIFSNCYCVDGSNYVL